MADLDRVDFAAWEVDGLSDDFEGRVMVALERDAGHTTQEPSRRSMGRGWMGVALAVAAAIVLVWAFALVSVDDVSSTDEVVEIAGRAQALAEPGARIGWSREADGSITVEHELGRARYEVDRGEKFRVVTPAGVVTVTGTVFTVEVESMTKARNKQMVGAAALAGTVVAAVVVLEGSVEVHNAYGAADVGAGGSAVVSDGSAPRAIVTPAKRPSKLAAAPTPAGTNEVDRHEPRRDPAVMREQIRQALTKRGHHDPKGEKPSADKVETRVFGSFDKEYIREVVREDLVPLAQECYEHALSRAPDLGGTMTLQFAIMGDETVGGVVDHVDLGEGTTIIDPEMTECIRQSMLSVVFDPPDGGGVVEVTYPIIFEPADDDESSAPEP